MQRVLVLGGTGWAGRETARHLIDSGADVTCLARGISGGVPDGAHLIRADRSAPGAYDRLRGEWDEVIEFSSAPDLVGPALDALADRTAHWTLVSTISVYARNDEPGADESAALVSPADLTQYPDAKVAAELATRRRLEGRLLIARPGLIVGPGDPSDRFGYWPARFSRSGPALLPVTQDRFVQVIDVADLAAWLARAATDGIRGSVNAVGEVHPMAAALAGVADAASFADDCVEADDDTLRAHDVQYWAGPRSLPLWLPRADTALAQRSGRRFLETGGRRRPLAETIERTLADERRRGIDRERRSGLTAAEERAILEALR
ncbi:NAD-dependent epimerase/dehydratase family protein [Microbacterium sp. NPDC077184]|uniref:NAD-dependent epimerase/dehydratase family protein n=1 Tax=Microbacterium sp. NPDC077184 TaxID=3154764 RepID=UPI00343D1DBD